MATPSSGSKWGAKHYILATLVAVLVAVAVAAAISISLAPARISFSIVAANKTTVSAEEQGSQNHLISHEGFYNFTLVASNPSRRMAARYGSLSAQIWWNEAAWVPAEVDTVVALPGWQQPDNASTVFVSALFDQSIQANATTCGQQLPESEKARISWPNHLLVVVETMVWFRSGLATTRAYTVTAFCWPVDFYNNATDNFPVDCST